MFTLFYVSIPAFSFIVLQFVGAEVTLGFASVHIMLTIAFATQRITDAIKEGRK